MDYEARYVQLLRGGNDNSPLLTDGYKFAMAQAGFPLRHEVFYLHFRKGGPLYCPFDFRKVVNLLRPRLPNSREQGFLLANGYGLTPAMETALNGDISVKGVPRDSWVNPQEPVLTLSGPSFLVSWMEALAISFQFPMQIATAIKDGVRNFDATCDDEAEIIRLVAEAMGVTLSSVTANEAEFRHGVRDRLLRLRDALNGDINRAFEVGTRSMTCYQHHRIVLEECKAAGITRTANVQGAYDLYLVPVGTTGHEHQERHGKDIDGFRAIRDLRPEPPSYLFDTYDPIHSGIPAAIQTMLEDRTRRCSVRFDSGDQDHQLRLFVEANREYGFPNLFYLFMDGYDDIRVRSMDATAFGYGIPAEKRHYGIGGWLVIDPGISPYSRNTIAMVFKLCQTGGPGYDGVTGCRNVRKYSGSKGKASLGGRPIVVVGISGVRWIAQEGEGFTPSSGILTDLTKAPRPNQPSKLTPETERIAYECKVRDLNPKWGDDL